MKLQWFCFFERSKFEQDHPIPAKQTETTYCEQAIYPKICASTQAIAWDYASALMKEK